MDSLKKGSTMDADTIKMPLILEVKGNSLDDGPGIRSVVFFKGCPLSCVWCHNPESQKVRSELSYDQTRCIGCHTCVDTCREGAIKASLPISIDRKRCTLCFECAETCPSHALERVGRQMAVEEIVDVVMRDKPFYDVSGGGVTLSGGEPTLAGPFTGALLKALKNEKVHTLMETCGHFRTEFFHKALLPYLDMIYFDLKLIDSREHVRYCGVSNEIILKNFEALHETAPDRVLARVPLVPGITDRDENLTGIATHLSRLNVGRVALLAYNPLWPDKCEKIGMANQFPATGASRSWMSKEKEKACQEIFERMGIRVTGGTKSTAPPK